MKLSLYSGALLLLIVSTTFVQRQVWAQHSFSLNTPLHQSVITQWTGDNGLISNNITSSIQSQSGFIWITTYNGIMRFDGRKVDVYDRSLIPFLNTDSFYAVYEDQKGTLWFASQGSGLIKYSRGKFEQVDPEGKILPKSIRCMLIEQDGSLWIGSNNEGLFFMKDSVIRKIDYPILDDISILDLAKTPNNSLWIATDGRGLVEYHDQVFREYSLQTGLLNNTINTLSVDKNNALWIGTNNGMNILSEGKLLKVDVLKNYQVNKLIIDAANTKWIGCELGLARLRNEPDGFEFLSEHDGYPLGRINFISFDRENSLWVSTGRNGLVQLKETHITNITTSEGLATNKINIIAEGPDEAFYVGSDIGKVDVYRKGKIEPYSIQTSLTDAGIRDILIENSTTFWIASYRGLLKKTGQTEKLFTTKHGLPAADIRRILKDKNNRIWIATRSGGVVIMENETISKVYNRSNGLKSNYILSLEEDRQGNMYIGTHSGGMTKILSDGTLENYSIQQDDSGMLIFNIYIDDHNHVWIVTNIGPYYLDGKSFRKLNLEKTIKGETYFDWVEDQLGSVWVTTNIGVLKINKEELENFIAGKIPSIKTRLYDNQDGMKSKECTGATRSHLSSDGKIWVPTIGGICVFDPNKAKENKLLPPVYITSMLVDNASIDLHQNLSIEPGKMRYSFTFTSPTFIAPGKIRFRYKLEPADADWIPADLSRQVEYTNLRPGEYTFRVVTSNSDGYWNDKDASLQFYVRPFFYQTAWFYVVIVSLLMAILYLIYRWRIYEVEKRNEELRKVNSELDRFVYSASHDLRAPLASILGLVNVARLDKGGNIDDYLNKIEKSVNKLDGFVKDIIDFSRNARVAVQPEEILFEPLIHEIIDDLKYLDDKNQMKRIVRVEGQGTFYTDRKRLTIVLSNLISNSIKYFNPFADQPFIEVSVISSSEKAVIQVRDNGTGIASEHVDNIFKMFYRGDTKSRGSGLGLYIVKETVEKIKGTIEVKSILGEGSTFIVTLPSLPKEL